ncbi:MAG: replication protein P [Plesiomonas shigelloides]
MNNLNVAIQRRDALTLARMMPTSNQQRVVNPQAERLVDVLFENLKRVFPAAESTVLKTLADEAAAKRQWILAFAENGITTKEQLAAGMRVARTVESDFFPSVGKFVSWCNAGAPNQFGLPAVDDVMDEFDRYSSRHHDYSSPELFPWSAPVMYWIVLDIRRAMYKYNHTAAEVRKNAEKNLKSWEKKLLAGETVPAPVVQVANKMRPASPVQALDTDERYKNAGMAMLAAIRSRKSVDQGVQVTAVSKMEVSVCKSAIQGVRA